MTDNKKSKQDHFTGTNHSDDYCYYVLTADGYIKFYTKETSTALFELAATIVKWWLFDFENRADAYNLIICAALSGCRPSEIERLVEKFAIVKNGCAEYMEAFHLTSIKTPHYYEISGPGFSWIKGQGTSVLGGIINYYYQMQYTYTALIMSPQISN